MREMTSMVTDVEVNRCALRVSGSEISWHLIVPISYHFIYFFNRQCKLGHLGYALSRLHFVPDMGMWDANYSSCIECQGSVRWSLLLYNSAECFLNIRPISQAERERDSEKKRETLLNAPRLCLRALHAFWSYRHAPSYMNSLWKVTQIHVADCNNWMKASQRQKKTRPLMSDCENGNKKRRESALE